MSKKSCEAAESIEDALLRMARVNCNLVERGGRFHARMKICLQKGTNGASELYNCTFLSYPARRCQLFLWNFPKRNGILNACFQNGAFLLQSYTEMIKVPVFLTGHRCVYENKKEN